MKLDHISQSTTNIYLVYDSAVFLSRIVSNLLIIPIIKDILQLRKYSHSFDKKMNYNSVFLLSFLKRDSSHYLNI